LEKVLRREFGLYLISKAVFTFLKIVTMEAFFQRVENIRCAKLSLKINLRTGIKKSQQHFITNAGIIKQVQDHI
jgi:hypothetical protein